MTVKPAAGEVVEQTTRTRVLTAPEVEEKEKPDRPEIWEFVETLKPVANLDKPEYEFTIYRGRKSQRADEKEWLGKFYEPMRREVIQQRFGGGEYNVWLKVGPGLQLRYNVDLKIGGQPIASPTRTEVMPTDATGQLVFMLREEMKALRDEVRQSRGGDLGLDAMRQALTLNGTVFNSAATAATETLRHLAGGGGAAAPNPMDDLMRQFMTAAIAKMMNPSDPIETFAKMAQAMSGLGIKLGGAPAGEKLTDKLVMGLVNQLPVLAQHVGGIMESYRKAEEIKLRNTAINRGLPAPTNLHPAPPPPLPPAPTNVITMPSVTEQPQQPSPEQVASAEQMLQYIENKIVEIFNNISLSPEAAAIQALSFIDVTDPVKAHPNGKNIIDEVLQYGQAGLDHIFSTRPILATLPRGDRLEEFKKAFLENGRRLPGPDQPNPNVPPA